MRYAATTRDSILIIYGIVIIAFVFNIVCWRVIVPHVIWVGPVDWRFRRASGCVLANSVDVRFLIQNPNFTAKCAIARVPILLYFAFKP
jgi:hypothetical protein